MLFRFLWCILCLSLGTYQTELSGTNCPAHFHFKEVGITELEGNMSLAFMKARKRMADRDTFEGQMAYDGSLISPTIHSVDARHYQVLYQFPEANQMDQMQTFFEEITRALKESMHLTTNQVQFGIPGTLIAGSNRMKRDCEAMKNNVTCNPSVYRTADGSCNNVNNPTWGKTGSCYRRLLPADYADGISLPRRPVRRHLPFSEHLPNPRIISLRLHNDEDFEAKNFTNMVTQFGEFISHGLIRTPMKRTALGGMIQCCNDSHPLVGPQHPDCLPITIAADDPHYGKFNFRCMNFVRSTTCANCAYGARNQTNELSSFIDGSQIYGSTDVVMKKLRLAGSKGLLDFTSSERAGVLLPPSDNPTMDQCSNVTENILCFLAGDVRVNQHPGLAATHTLWLQQHNTLARRLSVINPTWTDEKVFQETRKIVGAQLQMVAYNEYLPVVLGENLMEEYDLKVTPLSGIAAGRTTYDETIDPTIYTEFATAAYRFGHSLIRNEFKLTQALGSSSEIKLKDYFFFPIILYQGDEIPLMRGLSSQPAMAWDKHIVHAVTNFVYRMKGNDTTGKDLAALNIQRGRDHGLGSYVEYLNLCFNRVIKDFTELVRTNLMEPQVFEKFPKVYRSVEDIDLFSGGLSETALDGATVGPTFGNIIAMQFRNLKFGDRFYFEHGGGMPFFTDDQLAQIKRTTLAGILCDNSKSSTGQITNRITFLQQNVFRPASPNNPLVPCFASPVINLKPWEEVLRPIGRPSTLQFLPGETLSPLD